MAATEAKRTGRPPAGRLPAELTSFVGRQREVAEVKRLIAKSRVVTLTGVGGVGKTRLALRVAAEVRRAFSDGVWLVEFATLDKAELLVQAMAEALEVRSRLSRPPIDVLVEHLREKQTLIVLDNCEHLLPDCAVVVDRLLRSAAGLRILATSRQALGIAGEQMLPVPTMSLPGVSPSGEPVASTARCDAVNLFTERALSVQPGFSVTEANREAVERICRHLDGIPLAIELAAVRLRELSLEHLLDRLDDRFRLLTAGSPAALPRQQTLRSVIDWSYGLCTKQEQQLWARASVFAGSFSLEAAEDVCSGNGIAREQIVDLVIGLVDKSVLISEGYGRTVRYRLLETIRQYGRDRLRESGDEVWVRRRHRDWYRELAMDAEREWCGSTQMEWFARLRQEHSNVRTALDFCLTLPGEVSAGLVIMTALRSYWIAAGLLQEGRQWLDRLLAADTEPTVVRAGALAVNARFAALQSDLDPVAPMLEESRSLAVRFGDTGAFARISYASGLAALVKRDFEGAEASFQEAARHYRDLTDLMGETYSLMHLALTYSCLGQSDKAVELFGTCVDICESWNEYWLKASLLYVYGIEMWKQGGVARAIEMEHESIRLKQPFNDRLGIALCAEVLAWIAAQVGEFERAARLLGALREMWRSVGEPLFPYLVAYHDKCEQVTRQHLGEKRYYKGILEGTKLGFDWVLTLAWKETTPVEQPSQEGARSSPLTPREMEVARLVARGMSNKEVAASLVIAQRTAEAHVEHILNKLGFTSRVQIAAWVFEDSSSRSDAPGSAGRRFPPGEPGLRRS
ncbi:ATP-binding protein [Nonomuraea indica]|uniref:ATP-binding protein n=1 Tax=Nonomuraea indica TaxID=1581193 RepID=A0ABW8AGS7_9ACTN